MIDLSNIPQKVDGDLVTAAEFNEILAALRELQPKPQLAQSTISNGVVTQTVIPWQWTAVEHATNYILKEGNAVIYNGPNLSAAQNGLNPNSTHNVTLTAQAPNYVDSVSSASATTAGLPQLDSPAQLSITNIMQTGFRITIQAVINATGYVYIVNGNAVHSGTDLTFDVTGLTAGTNYSVGVYATATGYANSNAAVTNVNTQSVPKLVTPVVNCTNVTTSGFRITTPGVDHATTYVYKVQGNIVHTGPELFFDVTGLNFNTNFTAQVVAQANGYTDSDPGAVSISTAAINIDIAYPDHDAYQELQATDNLNYTGHYALTALNADWVLDLHSAPANTFTVLRVPTGQLLKNFYTDSGNPFNNDNIPGDNFRTFTLRGYDYYTAFTPQNFDTGAASTVTFKRV